MKQLNKIFLVFALSTFALPALAQTTSVSTFTNQAFAKASARTDTSATITVGAYPNIVIRTTSVGTDSANINVIVDGYVHGLWWNGLTSQVLTLGRPAAFTLAGSAHTGQVAALTLRDNGRIADLLQNASQIRVRYVLTAGAGDSTSATSYTSTVSLRKVTW